MAQANVPESEILMFRSSTRLADSDEVKAPVVRRDRMFALVIAYVVWLVAWFVCLVAVHLWWPSEDARQAVRATIPLAVAGPGVLFAYLFPLRLQFIRGFGELRTDCLSVVADIERARWSGASSSVDHVQSVQTSALFLRARVRTAYGRRSAVESALDALVIAADAWIGAFRPANDAGSPRSAVSKAERERVQGEFHAKRDGLDGAVDTACATLKSAAAKMNCP